MSILLITLILFSREEGKYKNNVLVTSNQKRHLFLIRSAKFRERIESAINAAQRASKIALQKADIAISRSLQHLILILIRHILLMHGESSPE